MSSLHRGIARSPSPSSAPSPKRQKLQDSTTIPSSSTPPRSTPSKSSRPPPPAYLLEDEEDVNDLGRGIPDGPGVMKVQDQDETNSATTSTEAVKEDVITNGNQKQENGSSSYIPPAPSITPPVQPVEEEDDDEEVDELPEPEVEEEDTSRGDMYLDTVSRANLEFDFERLCSKSLSNINVYCCLVCGKYFQGRGRGSWAYRHSVGENHRVWLNLSTEKFYVLPEGYQVSDPSLQDMISVLNPRYEPSSLSKFSLLPSQPSFTLSAQPYFPGYIGLNNIRANDYLNVITQLLLHVPPIRDYLLDPSTPALLPESRPTELVKRFAALAKRVWNPRLFKAQVSPHEFLQEVGKRSEGKFGMDKQGDPVGFLGWLLNTLHRDLGGNKKSSSSVIYKTFQGEVKIQTQEVIVDKRASRPIFDISRDIKTIKSPFLFLALDLPPAPIFQDLNENRIIPQVPLGEILAKYDGVTTQETGNTLKRHQLTRLPPYLILFIKRFTSNNFVKERNPTIVNFPLRGVDLKDHVDPKPSSPMASMYDLIANIPHETTGASTNAGPSGTSKKDQREEGSTVWKVHVRAGAGGGDQEKWFALQDLDVSEVRKEMVFLGETVVQVWERRDVEAKV